MADAAELVVRIRGDASDFRGAMVRVHRNNLEELNETNTKHKWCERCKRKHTSAYQGLASQLKNTGKGIKEVGESIDTITNRYNTHQRLLPRRCCECQVCDRF